MITGLCPLALMPLSTGCDDQPVETNRCQQPRSPVTVISIFLDACSLVFGAGACSAIGTPCYNTYATCADRAAYSQTVKQLDFCRQDGPVPFPGQIIRPYVARDTYLAQEIALNDALLINQRLSIVMTDEAGSDIGIDPYRASATTRSAPGGSQQVAVAGTFWRRLLARNPHYRHRRVEVRRALRGEASSIADMPIDFTGILDDVQIGQDGNITLAVVGLLQMTDVDYPPATDAALAQAITDTDTTFSTTPWTGVNRSSYPVTSQYPDIGWLKLDNELMYYGARSFDASTGITTFSSVQRGRGWEDGWPAAAAHAAGESITLADVMSGNPVDIIQRLLNVASIGDANIEIAVFQDLRDTWFNNITFSAVLHKPTKIKALLKELREQTGIYLWQGSSQTIHAGIISPVRPGMSYRRIDDQSAIIWRSASIADESQNRITRTAVYYNARPDASTDPAGYRRVVVVVDADAESAYQYASSSERAPAYSRWIQSRVTGDDYPRLLAGRLLDAGQQTRKITCDVEIKDADIRVGQIIELVSAVIQDVSGQPLPTLCLVVKREPTAISRVRYTLQATSLSRRYGYITPPGGFPDYDAATPAQRDYAFISPRTGFSDGSAPYLMTR